VKCRANIVFKLKEHLGVVLAPSDQRFDTFGSTFGCVFQDERESDFYFYYTGSIDKGWSRASIGIATSKDGINFGKYPGNPVISIGTQSVTPAVFKAFGKYWMVFAIRTGLTHGRSLGIAVAEQAFGPWTFLKRLIEPKEAWEGGSIDIGPSVVELDDDERLIFYSNVWSGILSRFIQRSTRRHIGLLRLRVSGSREIQSSKWSRNPLAHLNGERGSWNESLFCPGYLRLRDKHYLMPTGSTYSAGHHYKQYIGLVEDSSPFFENPSSIAILINGSEEKNQILPTAQSEIALDTPSPFLRGNEIWLYYAAMDRADGVWKTALSIFSIN
jgi:hypothetical protein